MDTSSGQPPPRLSRGAHPSPEDGACLMETVSQAARVTLRGHPTRLGTGEGNGGYRARADTSFRLPL